MQDLSYNECKQRGTPDFPIDYHYVNSSHPQYEMVYHWHIEYELIHILSGEFRLSLDGKEYFLGAGDLCLVPDGVLHGGMPFDCIYECIVFDMNMLRNRNFAYDRFLHKITHHHVIPQSIYHYRDPRPTRTMMPNIFYASELIFHSLREQEPGFNLLTISSLYLLFSIIEQEHYYTEETSSPLKTHKKTEQLKVALELIETSYQEQLTLDELSRSVGMSPKYFCRFFKQMTQKTPIDYLNNYRIERACYQLSTGDYTLIEVSLNCGFTDYSYFIKTFKKYKNTTPKKWCNHT